MKKIIFLLIFVLTLVGCQSTKVDPIEVNNSVDLTSTKADMSDYVLLKDNDHVYEAITMKESSRMYNEGGTGILYYGYPQCPFCNRMVSVLNDAAKELGVKVYYIDIYQEGSTQEDINGIFENLDSILDKDENNQPVFYVPEVVAVKNGKIVGNHVSLVDSYSDVSKDLTKSQHNELKDIYTSLIKSLQ